MDALKNKQNVGNKEGDVNTQLGAKRIKLETSEDEEEIMALLDEIDRMNPLPATVVPTQIPQVVVQVKDDFDGPSSDDFLAGETTVPASQIAKPIASIPQTETSIPQTDTRIPQTDTRIPQTETRIEPPLINNDRVLQFLPFPFFPETFAMTEWTKNEESLCKVPITDWSKLTLISTIKTMSMGSKVPLMLGMVREVKVNARDVGVTILDSSGEITATIHEKIMTRNKLRVHFGMTLLLSDVTIFGEDERLERHLVVTLDNVLKIFSNVHHV